MEKVNSVQAIKRYFEVDGGRKVTMDEFRALSATERSELAAMCAAALSLEIVNPS